MMREQLHSGANLLPGMLQELESLKADFGPVEVRGSSHTLRFPPPCSPKRGNPREWRTSRVRVASEPFKV